MMKVRPLLFLLFLLFPGCVFISVPGVQPLAEKAVGGRGDDKVLLIDISGVIRDEDNGGSIPGLQTRPNLTARIKEELDRAAADEKVRAVVLRIDTPGGSVTASDIIAHEIGLFKKRKRVPVVAAMMDLATSGGYYIASSADSIMAQPTTVTGSIGVVAYSVNASGLLDKIGITDQTMKSGGLKDMGSPLRPMTEEERRVLQSVIDSMYERFLDRVMDGRPGRFTREELRKVSDGRILTAGDALHLKLIDSIGYLDDAIEAAKKAAGIKEARIVTYAAPRAYKDNIYSSFGGAPAGGPLPQSLVINIDAGRLSESYRMHFMYLWLP